MPATEHRQRAALAWIADIAERAGLPWQVVGGLAVRAHGGTRPLHDIDIYMPFADGWADVLRAVRPHVIWGPAPVVDGPWDITYLKADYGGQRIEIGDSTRPRIRDGRSGAWVDQVIDFDASVPLTVLGRRVPVMPREQLIAYKTVLWREVDRQDLRDLGADPGAG